MKKTKSLLLKYYFLINYGLIIVSIIYLCCGLFIALRSTTPNFVIFFGISVLYLLMIAILRRIIAKYINYSDYVLNTQVDLNAVESYSKQVVKSKRYRKVLLRAKQHKQPRYNYSPLAINLNVFANIAKLTYYKGEFEESIKFSRTINFSELKISQDYITAYKMVQYGFCLRSLLMSKQIEKSEILFEKISDMSVRNAEQRVGIDTLLKISQAIKDIVCKKQPNDFIDKWNPQNKLFQVEKIYFQAKNEQLKGNLNKTTEYFKLISEENPDLFFVKEANKYLEENR